MLNPTIVISGNKLSNKVALTFDDGPNPNATPQILKILERYKARATFFVVGQNVKNYPELTKKIAGHGHEIGIHSYSHSRLLFASLPQFIEKDLKKTSEEIKSATGINPALFRPPFGFTSPWLTKTTANLNLITIKWSLDSRDAWIIPQTNHRKMAANLLVKVESGSIILMHDGSQTKSPTREATIKCLPTLIEGIQKKNLQLATVSDIL